MPLIENKLPTMPLPWIVQFVVPIAPESIRSQCQSTHLRWQDNLRPSPYGPRATPPQRAVGARRCAADCAPGPRRSRAGQPCRTLARSPSPPPCGGSFPGRVVHLGDRAVPAREDVLRVLAPLGLDDGRGPPVQHDQPLLPVLHRVRRDDEDRGLQLRHLHLPVPPKPADLLRGLHAVIHLPPGPLPAAAKGLDWADEWVAQGRRGFPSRAGPHGPRSAGFRTTGTPCLETRPRGRTPCRAGTPSLVSVAGAHSGPTLGWGHDLRTAR